MTRKPTLLAGVARSIISPPQGIYLIGYGDRAKGNTGVHDDLTATALVLDDGTTRVGIVALDMLAINEFIVDRVRAQVAPTEVILCCSHTHSGPVAYAGQESPPNNRRYIEGLVDRIVDAVKRAESSLAPARLEFSVGESTVGINRRERMADGRVEIGRNPGGPRDASVQVVSVWGGAQEAGGDLLATVVNYACHGTVLGPDNLLVSADWIGAMRRKVESQLGGMTLFLQGATADINPDMFWEDALAFDRVEEQGVTVGESVLEAVRAGADQLPATPIKVKRAEVWLPTETAVTSSRPPRNYGKPLLAMAHLPGFLSFMADWLLDRRYPWKPVIRDKGGYWSVPMRINVMQLGSLALVTFAAETFTEIGMEVKAGSPAAQTLFASVTDGCVSYLHTEASHGEGGYEVDVAPLAYRYPGKLQAGCEKIALAEAQRVLDELWG